MKCASLLHRDTRWFHGHARTTDLSFFSMVNCHGANASARGRWVIMAGVYAFMACHCWRHIYCHRISLSFSLLSIVPSLMLHHQTAISQLSLTRSYSSRTRIDSHLRHFWDFHLQAQSIRLLRNVSMHFIGTLNAVDIWLLFKLLFGYYNSNRRWQEQQHQPSNAVCIYMILEWHASWGHRNALMAYTESVMTYMCMNGTCNDN